MNNRHTTRIARNTALLYVRMAVMLVVTLYTERIVLHTLGLTDYGIFELVGSVTALFWFLNTAMATATQRFLNFEMGRGNDHGVRRVFSMSVNIHLGVAAIVLILGETVGLWLLNNWLEIPAERLTAANWVLHLSVLTSCLNIIRVPYNASIIAHERMSFYAVASIVEAVLRLGAVMLLVVWGGDKLIAYAVLTCIVVGLVTLIYRAYCIRRFDSCRYRWEPDRKLFRSMIGFSGWSLLGSGANAASQKGTDMIMNVFFGVMMNAPLGLANKVSSAIYGFILNFQTAFNPQIVKSYAAGDRTYFHYLIFRTSKYSYYLMLLIAIPVMLYTETILALWLGAGEVPAHTASFIRLILCFLLIDAVSGPLWTSVQATGRIRAYQITMSALILTNLPLVYAVLRLGMAPESALAVRVGVNLITYIVRIFYLRRLIDFPALKYAGEVILRVLLVTVAALPLPLLTARFTDGFWGLAATVAISCLSVGASAYLLGMERSERGFFIRHLRKFMHFEPKHPD